MAKQWTFRDVPKSIYFLKLILGMRKISVDSGQVKVIVNIFYICALWIFHAFSFCKLIDFSIKASWFQLEETVFAVVLCVEYGVLQVNLVFEFYYRQEIAERLMNWKEADDSLQELGITIDYRRSGTIQLQLIGLWLLLCFGIDGVTMLWLWNRVPFLINLGICTILPHGMHLNTLLGFCYIMTIKHIRVRFQMLNETLRSMAINNTKDELVGQLYRGNSRTILISTIQPAFSFTKKTTEMIQVIKQLHLEYNKLAKRFTHIHAIKLITTSISTFVMITGLLYMLYLIIFKRHDFYDAKIFILLIWLAQNFTKLYLLNFECSTTSAEFLRTREIIHNLEIVTQDTELQQEIHQFSMQILQTDLIFEPYGLFAAGYDLLRAMGESILTLVVILIQYSPDIKSN